MVEHRDGRYAIDIRVFLTMIALTMAASFIAGVTMIPLSQLHSDSSSSRSSNSDHSNRDSNNYLLNVSASEKEELDQHHPSGQHLLVDMKHVHGDFLNSEERLSKAMVDTVQESGLTMLSYHCHALIPSGVSCVGVLLESHISFHTWPSEGVITLDLFTCGPKPLLPVVATIERLFGIPNVSNSDGDGSDAGPTAVKTQWSHELRGFRPIEEMKKNYLADSSDLSLWVLSPLEMHSKTQIYSGMTGFQRVDIWDIVELGETPSHEDVIKHNMTPGDPRLIGVDYVSPDRLLFLDGTIQSMRSSERVYHEAMVHPAMFAHPNPRHVAILGGGEGATLREVLKHKTVESAVMIEIDEDLVQISREFLPGFSDCSDLVGRADNCFDDDLASIEYTDGRQYFIDRFGKAPSAPVPPEKFDVVMVDALDPEESTEISDMLYSDESFLSSLINGLSDDGVLVIQVGTAATIDDPKPDHGVYQNRERLFQMLERNPDVAALLVFEESHCGFLEPHSFLLVCKSADCRSRWYARSDQVDYQIYERIVRTKSQQRALTFFDGTTQRTYQWPKKGWETVYCRREPTPFECAYRSLDPEADVFDVSLQEEEESDFRIVTKDKSNPKASSVFAKVDMPQGSYIMPEHLASSLQVTSRNLEGLKKNVEVGGGRVAVIEDLLEFFEDYEHESAVQGSGQHFVEVGGSVLIRRTNNAEEVNVVKWVPEHPSGAAPKYSPVYERHRISFDVFLVASRDIAEGEEIVMHQDTW